MNSLFKFILLLMVLLSTPAFSEDGYLIEKKISFSNGSSLTQVTKNTLIPTPDASSTVPDNTSQIMKLHGQLLLNNGLLIDTTFLDVKSFMDSCAGMISAFASGSVPPGWLLCDGATYSTTSNCELQTLGDAIRTNWGGGGTYTSGHFVGTFKVPDLRGMFLRGADSMHANGSGQPDGGALSGTDSDQRFGPTFLTNATNIVGSYQPDSFVSHGTTHTLSTNTISDHSHSLSGVPGGAATGSQDFDTNEDEYSEWMRTNEGGITYESQTSSVVHSHTLTLLGDHKLSNTSTTNSDTTSHPKNYAVVYGIRF